MFHQSETVLHWTALLLPRRTLEDIIQLHSFCCTAHNYAAARPQHTNAFRNLVATWQEARGRKLEELQPHKDDKLNLRVTKNMTRLMHEYAFNPDWIDAFLHSMEMDIRQKSYYTLDDTLRYVYGSAEVIGLMVANIMNLPDDAMGAAAMQGRAMQWFHFVRDIAQDDALGRHYIPDSDLKQFGLPDLSEKTANKRPAAFKNGIQFQLTRYREWQREANRGMELIPKRQRVPLQAAADSYQWTAKRIANDPFIVYRQKLEPGKLRIFGSALAHVLD